MAQVSDSVPSEQDSLQPEILHQPERPAQRGAVEAPMIATEQVFTFAELAKRLPRVGEKKIHVSTLHRWCRRGVRGVQLECRMLGRRMVTSLEAVDRFSARLAEAGRLSSHGPLPERSGGRVRQRRSVTQ
jgi:hypothetical protein